MLYSTFERVQTLNTSGTWSGNVYSYRGVDFTVYTNEKGAVTKIHSEGTATGNSSIVPGYYDFRNGITVIMNGCPAGGSGSTYRMYVSDTGVAGYDNGGGKTITPTADIRASVRIQIISGQTVNLDWYPMLRPATDTDPTFVPSDYVEIDPSFGSTIYGGEYDIVTGKLADYYEVIDLGDKTWTRGSTAQAGHYRYYTQLNGAQEPVASTEANPNSKCTGFDLVDTTWNCKIGYTIAADTGYVHIYSAAHDGVTPGAFKTAMTGIKLCFRKVTPTISSKTAENVDLYQGQNNINARRANDMTVVYESEE